MTDGTNLGAVLINESPRPRLLVRGFYGNDELRARLMRLAPTARIVDDLASVRQAEWDVLITDQGLGDASIHKGVAASRHLCVVYVDSYDGSPLVTPTTVESRAIEWSRPLQIWRGHISQELQRVTGLSPRIAALTHETLEPVLKSRDRHTVFMWMRTTTAQLAESRAATGRIAPRHYPELLPFIASADGGVLAGRYQRGPSSEAWLLPADTPDIVPWVVAALGEWHDLNPGSFPGVPDWSHQDEWMTSGELAQDSALSAFEIERAETIEALDRRGLELRANREQARQDADQYERALLTSHDDELVAAVARCLRELGFEVADSDATAGHRDRLEDLQIRDPSDSDWVALVEVKGYTKGAKTEAFAQLARFSMRYLQRTGETPRAEWYVVNQFRNSDPSTRQPVLHGKDDDVQSFAAANGLVIDTVVLFRILDNVRSGTISAEDARELLRTSTGLVSLAQPL